MIFCKIEIVAFFIESNLIIIGILYPLGEPILPHLLRYSPFVVKDHNFMRCALHLQQPRLVNNPGPPELFIKIADRINIIPRYWLDLYIPVLTPPIRQWDHLKFQAATNQSRLPWIRTYQ